MNPSAPNAEDLIRQALTDLEARRSRLASELAELDKEIHRHRGALTALTGKAIPSSGGAVTRAQVRDELLQLLREQPSHSASRKDLEPALKERIKSRRLKLTNFSRRLAEVLQESDGVTVGADGVLSLQADRASKVTP